MKAKITDRLVKSLKPSQKPYEVVDTEVAGFMMRVQPLGTMIYYVTCRLHDRRRNRVRLGSARVLSPSQARNKAKEVLAEKLRGGMIPSSQVVYLGGIRWEVSSEETMVRGWLSTGRTVPAH
jgi:hypothetical protein